MNFIVYACKHILRKAFVPSTICLSTTSLLYYDKQFDGKASTAISRISRAVVTVSSIVLDYKMSLKGMKDKSDAYTSVISRVHKRSAIRLKELCKINGGAYIKVGQHLGSLDYLLPLEYTSCLKELHSRAPISPIEDVFSIIEEDLGESVHSIFMEFEEKPAGAASLAQVHKARLKQSGEEVAVKVQHKVVKQNSEIDILTMELLVNLVAKSFPEFSFMWLVEETKKNLPLELDFLHEGRNCEKVEKMFKHLPFLKVPKIYWKYSSKRVLTMEFCEGGQIDDKEYSLKNKINMRKVISYMTRLYSEMIYETGYIHCDPHPGNVLIRNVSKRKCDDVQLVLLDHGLYQTLTDEFRLEYTRLWLSLVKSDIDGIKKHCQYLGVGHLYGLVASIVTARSWNVVTKGMNKTMFDSTEEEYIRVNAGKFLPQIAEVLSTIPRQMLLILKTNDLLRSIEYKYNMRSDPYNLLLVTKSCFQSIYEDNKKNASTLKIIYYYIGFKISLLHLKFYAYFLSISNSTLFKKVMNSFGYSNI